MSKWLSSVNNLLEKLDDTAEAVAEERRATAEEDVLPPAPEIEEILAKRGLAADSNEIQAQESQIDNGDALGLDEFVALDGFEDGLSEHDSEGSMQEPTGFLPEHYENDRISEDSKANPGSNDRVDKEAMALPPELGGKRDIQAPKEPGAQSDDHDIPNIPSKEHTEMNMPTVLPRSLPAAKISKSGKEMELVMEVKEAQKEARTLRRHVVSLNSQLESAEVELQAQRKELEQAAEQMEKDRARAKEAKEAAKKLHTKELETLRSQHERALNEQQTRFEQQVESYRKKLRDMESQKKQEDGDWSKEMTSVMEREKELNQQLMSLEYVLHRKLNIV